MDLFFRPKVRVEDFEAATMPHFPDLYRTARLLAQNSAEAEDLVQEVYLQAWKSFHRFETGTNCRAWLFKILFHWLHHFRRRWAKAAKVEAFENPEDMVYRQFSRDENLHILQRRPRRGVQQIDILAGLADGHNGVPRWQVARRHLHCQQ
jgi:RNA polymerase sigma factor (sigma-70 family)